MWLRSLIVTLVGVAGGAALGAFVAPQPADRPPAPASCEQEFEREVEELAALEDRAQREERELFLSRIRRAFARAGAREWPDGHHPALAPDALAEHLADTLVDSPADLLELDCDSFPCVATMSWEHQPLDEGLIKAEDGRANLPGELLARLQGEGPYANLPVYFTGRQIPGEPDRSIFSVSFLDPVDVSTAKHTPSEQAADQGTFVEQAYGRTEAKADAWVDGEQP